MLRGFTTYYQDKSNERQQEYLEALSKNIQLRLFDEIIVLIEEGVSFPFEDAKVKLEVITSRPSFQLFFDTINKYASEECISVLFNTDVYFNETLSFAQHIGENEVYALNRWDVNSDGTVSLFPKYSTNDVWIFRGKVDASNLNYYLGQIGCDNRLLYDLKEAGFSVFNPSLTILSFHLHQSNLRGILSNPTNQVNRVPAPYGYTVPEYLKIKGGKPIRLNWSNEITKNVELIRKAILFQYYYDYKNNLIEHAHELLNAKPFSKINYWKYHDLKRNPLGKNKFDRDLLEGISR